ncbi:hypothetical protein V0288_19340 [Pannus brasiliensis CCIBt3594]|uniref:Uncharacterized protein n=1 Tax=Pannus brasiliensis CCIBt3594 TaxID=1427578 RepID=A0AAW9R0T2_9CHRO
MAVTPKSENSIDEPLLEREGTSSLFDSSQDSKAIFLQQAGAFRDDSSLVKLRNSIYQARGRSESIEPGYDLGGDGWRSLEKSV